MTECIIKNTNSTIRENDIFIHLGDLAFGKGNAQKLIDRLNCKNIILLSGNHNHEPIKSDKIRLECDYLELRFTKKTLVCMFHYPIASWNEQNHFSICLHGHEHLKCKREGRIKDMDINGNNMFPYKLTDVVKELLAIPLVNNKGH